MSARIVHVNRIRKIISIIWLILFTFSYFIMTYNNTMIPGNFNLLFYLSLIRDNLILVSIVGIVLNYLSESGDNPKKGLFVLAFKLAILLMCYYIAYLSSSNQDNFTIWLMIVFAITADAWEEDVLLKIGFTIGTLIVVIVFFLSITGIIENNRGSSFGFTYRTHYACFLLCMALVYTIIKDGWFTWIGELGLIALDVYVFWLGGKTAFICLSLLTVALMWRHYRRNEGRPFQDKKRYGYMIPAVFRLLYLPICGEDWIANKARIARMKNAVIQFVKYSFLIGAALTYAFTFSYAIAPMMWIKLMGPSTFVSRLFQNLIGFEEYPLTLFGNAVPQAGFSGSEKVTSLYFAIDGAYAKLPVQYGIIITIILIGLMTWVQVRLYMKHRYFSMFVISIFALDCILEYQMINLSYNVFIMMSFCILSNKPDIIACDKFDLSMWTSRQRCGLASVLVTAFTVFAIWCVTAYKITNWRGWTPDYDATVVIPGDFMNGDSISRLTRAKNYLLFHEGTACIVPDKSYKNWLIDNDIGDERITVCNASDIDEMITNADRLIREKNLPPRLTVCTYDIQQDRVSSHADALGIPVNSLTLKAKNEYMTLFAEEQWKILWGE